MQKSINTKAIHSYQKDLQGVISNAKIISIFNHPPPPQSGGLILFPQVPIPTYHCRKFATINYDANSLLYADFGPSNCKSWYKSRRNIFTTSGVPSPLGPAVIIKISPFIFTVRNGDGLFVFFFLRFQTKRAQRRTFCVAGSYQHH